jgi:hypothetical protein
MKIELLYFEGCPSYRVAEGWLRDVLVEADVSDPIRLIEIRTEADAQHRKFLGSPTIRFDGVDPFEHGETAYGLECRVYLTPDGLRGWPTKDMLRTALNNLARQQSDSSVLLEQSQTSKRRQHHGNRSGVRYASRRENGEAQERV